MSQLYVLELEGGKYYVGVSDDPQRRFLYHCSGEGAAWTRMHPPTRILKIIPVSSDFDEDKVTKECMALYGIDNVRGGSYVNPTLQAEDRKALKKEIWMAQRVCMRCGYPSHYVTNCYARTDVCGDSIEEDEQPEAECCGRCYRTGHTTRDCYARTNVHGDPIEENEQPEAVFCGRCYRRGHTRRNCYASTDVTGRNLR